MENERRTTGMKLARKTKDTKSKTVMRERKKYSGLLMSRNRQKNKDFETLTDFTKYEERVRKRQRIIRKKNTKDLF